MCIRDSDNGVGAYITFGVFWGTNYTASMSLETWGAANDSVKTPDNPTNWYNTNDATLEFTGIQLEVGDTATSFEHRTFVDELLRCQRYYYQVGGQTNDGQPDEPYGVLLPMAMCANSVRVKGVLHHPVPMRTGPTVSGGGSGTAAIQQGDNTPNSTLVYQNGWSGSNTTRYSWVDLSPNSGTVSNVGETGIVYAYNSTYHLSLIHI